MADLKPCPLCGGEAVLWRAGSGRAAWIACMGKCSVLVSRGYENDDDAIAAWNRRAPDPRDEVIRGLREALKPLVAIADAFDANELDDEARKFWGQHGVNTTPHENIELYAGRGGKELLTLADCMLARQLVRQPYMGQIMAECDCQRRDECQRAGRCIAEGRG